MTGMEINAGEPFDVDGRTVTDLVSWLQSQDQNAEVKPKGGGSLVFRRLRARNGGGLEVEHVEAPKERPKSKVERTLEKRQLSRTTDTQAAEQAVQDSKRQSGPGGRTKGDDLLLEDEADTHNTGKDQGGTVPGTGKTGSEKEKK